MQEKYFHHIVLISFLPEAKEEEKQEIINRYRTLGEDCGGKNAGVLFWLAKPNLDLRKNIHLVEIAIFDSEESLNKFKEHPKHKEVVELLKKNANWFVGDLVDIFPTI